MDGMLRVLCFVIAVLAFAGIAYGEDKTQEIAKLEQSLNQLSIEEIALANRKGELKLIKDAVDDRLMTIEMRLRMLPGLRAEAQGKLDELKAFKVEPGAPK